MSEHKKHRKKDSSSIYKQKTLSGIQARRRMKKILFKSLQVISLILIIYVLAIYLIQD